jgi:hypothetical protein
MTAYRAAIRTAECCRESSRILDDARRGLVLGGSSRRGGRSGR